MIPPVLNLYLTDSFVVGMVSIGIHVWWYKYSFRRARSYRWALIIEGMW